MLIVPLGVKKVVLVSLRVFTLKRFTVGFCVTFQDTKPKKVWQEIMCCLRIGTQALRDKIISSHYYKAGSWQLLEVVFEIFDEHPNPIYMGIPPGHFHINHLFALLYLPTKQQHQRTQNSSCNVDPAVDPVVNIHLPNFSVCNSQEFFQRISALSKVSCKF